MLKYLTALALLALSPGAALADEAKRLGLEAAALVVQAESMDDRKKRHAALEDARDKVSEIAERFPDAFSDMHVQLYRYGKRTRMSMSDLSELIEEHLPPPCTGDYSETPNGCLMKLSNDCYMPVYGTVTAAAWTGECRDGVPAGTGRRAVAGGGDSDNVSEGAYVDGKRNGVWLGMNANGWVWEGPYVDGRRAGTWVSTSSHGTREDSFVTGSWVWVEVKSDGTVTENTADGMVEVDPHGTVWELAYGDGWVTMDFNGAVQKGKYLSDGTPKEGRYRVNVKTGAVYKREYPDRGEWEKCCLHKDLELVYRKEFTEDAQRLTSKASRLVEKSKELLRKGAAVAEKGKRLAGDL